MDVPTERALAAVVAVARAHGLRADRPTVVRDLTNVLVHLEPARSWRACPSRWPACASPSGSPRSSSSRGSSPTPEHRWRWALPRFDRLDEIGRLLDDLSPSEAVSGDELAALREAHARLATADASDGRPVHGDAHLRNILWSPGGPLWTDLENVCAGPVEYNLAALVWRGVDGTDEALAAYGDYDEATVERVIPFLALFLAAWTIPIVERDRWSAGGRAELRRRLDWILGWLD